MFFLLDLLIDTTESNVLLSVIYLEIPLSHPLNTYLNLVSTKQSRSVQFSSLRIREVIFAVPLLKVLDGTNRTILCCLVFLFPHC